MPKIARASVDLPLSGGLALLAFAAIGTTPTFADVSECRSASMGKTCVCDLAELRPLQGAVGQNEVAFKEDQIRNHPEKEHEKLKDDPVKVLLGPDGRLYIIDHHHTADAWLKAETTYGSSGYCQILNADKDLPSTFGSDAEFLSAVTRIGLARLKDKDGRDVSALPRSLPALGDDPYRDLAWLVRESGGYCKSGAEFAEFQWADWYRDKGLDVTSLPARPCESNPAVDQAILLAHSNEAKHLGLPGYSAKTCADSCQR